MILNKKYFLFSIVLLFLACQSESESWFNSLNDTAEIQDENIKVSIAKIPFKVDSTSLSYRVRLFPTNESTLNQSEQVKERLMYRMDSCFYLNAGVNVVYPSSYEYINGGIPNTYEYLVTFDIEKKIKSKDLYLNYQDKYINHQKYTLKLKKDN